MVVENFCGACIAAPLALAGVGVSASATSKNGDHRKNKKKKLVIGLLLTILPLLYIIYKVFFQKCSECKL